MNFYGGISRDGKNHVLVIDGEQWNFAKSTYMTRKFGNLPIGATFDLPCERDDEGEYRTLSPDWDALHIPFPTVMVQDEEVLKPYIIANEAQKKNRSLASAKKKLDAEALMDCTISDLQKAAWSMSKAQRAALIALIIAEVGA